MMETINVADIQKIATKNDYKHVGLYDASGKCIVALNSPRVTLKAKFEAIKKKVGILPDGYYTVRYQENIGKRYPVYDKIIKIGNPTSAPGNIIAPAANTNPTEQVRGWDEALSDKTTIANLTAELQALKKEKELEDQLADDEEDEEEDEEEGAGLMEKGKSLLSDVLPQFLPVFDKHFAIKDRQLDLKQKELELREKEINLRSQQPNPVANTGNLRSVHPWRPIPQVGEEKFKEYIEFLRNAPDDIFNIELQYQQQSRPEVFEICKQMAQPPNTASNA